MPPDLAADPPWHLTFRQPLPMAVVEGGNFTALAGAHNTDTTVAGQQTYGCLPEETVEQGAHRCLRFTSGFASLGPGKFEVYGSSTTPVATEGGPLYQGHLARRQPEPTPGVGGQNGHAPGVSQPRR